MSATTEVSIGQRWKNRASGKVYTVNDLVAISGRYVQLSSGTRLHWISASGLLRFYDCVGGE